MQKMKAMPCSSFYLQKWQVKRNKMPDVQIARKMDTRAATLWVKMPGGPKKRCRPILFIRFANVEKFA